MSITKRQVQSGAGIDSALTEKMNWIVSGEGLPSEFLDDYFLSGDINLGLPALAAPQSGTNRIDTFFTSRGDAKSAKASRLAGLPLTAETSENPEASPDNYPVQKAVQQASETACNGSTRKNKKAYICRL
jgi:hypothetical protein